MRSLHRQKGSDRQVELAMTPAQAKVVRLATEISQTPPNELSFQHSILCQVGLPRSPMPTLRFERTSGSASLLIEAGSLWDGSAWVQQPLPSGTKPRLALVHISSEALRTGSATVDVGRSTHGFMKRLGIDTNGRSYAGFRHQLAALSACRITLGFNRSTIDSKLIERFNAWDADIESTAASEDKLEPGVIVLSHQFYESLREHSVPLDGRAVSALQKSSLALDIYFWLAHRLHRIDRVTGSRLTWQSLQTQFGQEYSLLKDFKRDFRHCLKAVKAVYRTARVEELQDTLVLLPSPPPVPRTWLALSGGSNPRPLKRSL